MEKITAKKESLKIILQALKAGKVLICPTETVYGLLCDATNKKAVERIFKIKKREKAKPLGIFVKDIKIAKEYAIIGKNQEKILKEKWPGKFTFILKKKPNCGLSLIGTKGTIGIRIPNYKFVADILNKFKKPIAQTSANISGKPATTKIKEVLTQFAKQKARPDLAVDAGDLSRRQSRRGSSTLSGPKAKPSKVIDLINNNILRK